MYSIETLRDAVFTYTGNSPLFWFLPAALLLSLFGKKETFRRRAAFASGVLLICLALYNPLTFRFYGRFVGASTYYRFLWILPCYAAIAYILSRLLSLVPNDRLKLVLTLMVCLPVLYRTVGPSTFFLPYSVWQVPAETSFFADRMDALMDEGGLTQSVLLCDEDIAFTIRSYDPRLILPADPKYYTSGKIVEWQNGSNMATLMTQLRYNDVVMDSRRAEKLLRSYNVHFVIVFKDDSSSTDFLKEHGFTSGGVCRDRELFYRI